MSFHSRKLRSDKHPSDQKAFDGCILGVSFIFLPVGFALLLARNERTNQLFAWGGIFLDLIVAAAVFYKTLKTDAPPNVVHASQTSRSLFFSWQFSALILALTCLLVAFLLK
jgi:hypothetical protein